MVQESYDVMYKIVLVGDPGVGKTNLLAHFIAPDSEKDDSGDGVSGSFSQNRKPTVGVEFATKIIRHPTTGVRIKAQIWCARPKPTRRCLAPSLSLSPLLSRAHRARGRARLFFSAPARDTAGQERYRAITSSHYRRASGALLVYDASIRKSFESAKYMWLKELREAAAEGSPLPACTCLTGNKIDLAPQVADAEHAASVSELGLTLSARTSAKTGQGVDAAFTALIVAVRRPRARARRCVHMHAPALLLRARARRSPARSPPPHTSPPPPRARAPCETWGRRHQPMESAP